MAHFVKRTLYFIKNIENTAKILLVQKKIVPLQTILRFCALARTRLWHENCKLSRKFEVRNMKVKFGVLVGCVLCALSVACLGFLSRFEKSKDSWTPEDVYMQLGGSSYSTVSSGASSSDDVLVSMRGMSRMSRRVSAPAFSHAPSVGMTSEGAGVGSTYPSLQGGAGVGSVYTTSSAQFHSFGGGNNVGMSMSGGSVQSSSSVSVPSMGMNVSMPSTSIYALASQNSNVNIPIVSGDAAIASVMSSSAYTSSYSGVGVGGGTSRGISGRRNAAPTFNDPWWKWFDSWVSDNGSGYGKEGEEGAYIFDRYDLWDVYQSFLTNYWNSGMGEEPSFDEWLDWYQQAMLDGGGSYGYNGSTYYWQPIGGVMPLLVMLLMYATFVLFRGRNAKAIKK